MNMHAILDYLGSLEQNNNQEWFHANKEQYREANQAFLALIDTLQRELQKTDSSLPLMDPGKLTFKLQRDTRFSADKSPYNPSFRAHISAKGKLPIPVGYFIQIRPGDRTFLGGGLFADMWKDATAMIRDRIVSHGGEWQSILSSPEFARRFTLQGAKLQKVPRGYDMEHPQAESLKHKSWYLEVPVLDSQLTDANFVEYATQTFTAMQPFNAFINQALETFQMPER